ncbi:hypothetical protein ACTFXK_05620 [Pseudomonas aeruginosa]|uniref:hypothetical protein n=1 Tax=Pseudomonas aeruginosa TaxID=287 RepID=UPI001AD73ED8|nr:hypothetical protein [Pseudomonas aeruginosa]MBO7952497.1 hypothetical protein [Pseudomonas aeruginosa]MBO7976298.1 hypothetical protein [Pseudomonas aeruginosa]
MNTEQFIRNAAARGLSRRATMQALGLGRWKFDLIIGAMEPIEWAKNGTTLGNRLAYEASRGRFTPAQAAALERAHERWSESRRFTVRRRVAAGMSLRDALTTPRQQPRPGRRHPWNRSQKQVQP